MIENIEQAREEFEKTLGFIVHPSKRKIREYIRSNEELLIVFEAKRHLPKHALQARLRIQAAEEYLNSHR